MAAESGCGACEVGGTANRMRIVTYTFYIYDGFDKAVPTFRYIRQEHLAPEQVYPI